MNFTEYLKQKKPIIGMIHLKGKTKEMVLDRAKREIDIYLANGVDAVLVENYFGDVSDCEAVLCHLHDNRPDAVYGVNILGDFREAFRLSAEYGAKFIQIDSVCGHLRPDKDVRLAEELSYLRGNSQAAVLGGVRFKYQPVKSGRSLEEDLRLGMERCDSIVVTGEGTGQATPMDKVREFRRLSGDFPLIVGAGVTADTVAESLDICDGVIVGSWFKHDHSAYEDVCPEYVCRLVKCARIRRNACACCGEAFIDGKGSKPVHCAKGGR